MNPKIQKLREEIRIGHEKIASIQERNREKEKKLTALENTEIIGLVREMNMTPEQLEKLLFPERESTEGEEAKTDEEKSDEA